MIELLMMVVAAANMLRCDWLMLWERCLVGMIIWQRLVADYRYLEKRLLVLVERIDSFSVLTMWELGLFLE